MNTIEFLTALLSIETIVLLYHLTDGRTRNPRRMSEMMEGIFTLKNGMKKVFVSFYAEYEMTVLETHPEKSLGAIPGMALDHVLRRKKGYGLNKGKIAKEASVMAKKIEKKINPRQDMVGEIKIVIETIRKATDKDLGKK
ncbi:MAG: hypothetical protein WC926_02285 [Candidatus Paceibacterota bacterium]|jgi:hypothetical protein